MTDHSARKRPLPCRADRKKIVEQAKLVQTHARALAKRLDRSFTAVRAPLPGEGENAAAWSLVATAAGGVFIARQS